MRVLEVTFLKPIIVKVKCSVSMKKTFKVSVILRSELNNLEDIQKWLSKYNNLKVTVKGGYLDFDGNPEFQVVPSRESLTLYWSGCDMKEFILKRNKFFNIAYNVPIALKLGAQILQQGSYWLKLLTANGQLYDEAALLAIHMHCIKETMQHMLKDLYNIN